MTSHRPRLRAAAALALVTLTAAAIAALAPALAAGQLPIALRAGVSVRRTLDLSAPASALALTARLASCAHSARLQVSLDGRRVTTITVRARSWTAYAVPGFVAAGRHSIGLRLTSARRRGCARPLSIQRVAPVASPPAGGGANPFAGARLWVDPDTSAARQVQAWSASRPADAAQIQKIAAQPQAQWFDGNSDASDIAGAVNRAAAADQLPVLVAYDIPNRDCGGYSGGGAGSPDAYRTWIDQFAGAIGAHRAVVIVEPDALAELDCLSGPDQQTYDALIRYAVATLGAEPGVSVYVDAGNSGWQPASLMAQRLQQAGVAQARGFAINVSNFDTTAAEAAYGHAISSAVGGKPFVIDTSRNGLGPAGGGEWCNPPGRALGDRPTAQTGDPLIDALLWVKTPGESDGTCNGGPDAGVWWADYALGLAQRAAF